MKSDQQVIFNYCDQEIESPLVVINTSDKNSLNNLETVYLKETLDSKYENFCFLTETFYLLQKYCEDHDLTLVTDRNLQLDFFIAHHDYHSASLSAHER